MEKEMQRERIVKGEIVSERKMNWEQCHVGRELEQLYIQFGKKR